MTKKKREETQTPETDTGLSAAVNVSVSAAARLTISAPAEHAARLWLNGGVSPDFSTDSPLEHDYMGAVGTELSRRLSQFLGVPTAELAFLSPYTNPGLVQSASIGRAVFRAHTAPEVREAISREGDAFFRLFNFPLSAVVRAWCQYGVRHDLDSTVFAETLTPKGLRYEEREGLLRAAAELYGRCADIMRETVPDFVQPQEDRDPRAVLVFTPDMLQHSLISAADVVQVGGVLLSPSAEEIEDIIARNLPAFVAIRHQLSTNLADHSYSDEDLRGLLDAVAPRWVAEWPMKRLMLLGGVVAAASDAQFSARLASMQERLDDERRKNEALRQKLDDAGKKQRSAPAIRQSTHLLRALMQQEGHVQKSRQKLTLAGKHSAADAEARRLFRYEPIGWAERTVIHALAALAREAGMLDTHPWALMRRPLHDTPAPRVLLQFPGIEHLARVAGFEPGPDGRIKKDDRQTIERALLSLATVPRWIPELVLVPVKKNGKTVYIEDTRVVQTLWVEMSATELTQQTSLYLHPVAIAAHLASFLPAENLAAEYRRAATALKRRGIGGGRMRDEWAFADDYFRYRASVKLGETRHVARKQKDDGDPVERMLTAGEQTIRVDVADSTLRGVLDLERLKLSEAQKAQRVREVFAFLVERGTIRDAHLDETMVWRVNAAIPGIQLSDPAQGVLFVPDSTGAEV